MDEAPHASDRIVDNRAMSRFELAIPGGEPAVAYYSIEDGRIVLRHTEVPFEYSGLGYGSRLARAVFELLKAKGMRVIATCPFMSIYAARHPEYAAMLEG
jgi:predicted GNAT family acetyltransferase